MQKSILIATLILMLCSGCTGKNESKNAPEIRTKDMRVHSGSNNDSPPVSLADIVKKQALPDFPGIKIGTAFDGYSHFSKKEWKESRGTGGTVYIDLIGWFGGTLPVVGALNNDISAQGLDVKFVIKPSGVFFIGMISKLEAKTDGSLSSNPIQDLKPVLESIYANKKITF